MHVVVDTQMLEKIFMYVIYWSDVQVNRGQYGQFNKIFHDESLAKEDVNKAYALLILSALLLVQFISNFVLYSWC